MPTWVKVAVDAWTAAGGLRGKEGDASDVEVFLNIPYDRFSSICFSLTLLG
jgi:hypothetical protein